MATLTLSLLDTYDKFLLQQQHQQEAPQPQQPEQSQKDGSTSRRKPTASGASLSPVRASKHRGRTAGGSNRQATAQPQTGTSSRKLADHEGHAPRQPLVRPLDLHHSGTDASVSHQQTPAAPSPQPSPRAVHFAPELVVSSEAQMLPDTTSSPQHRVASPVRSSLRSSLPVSVLGDSSRDGSEVYAPPTDDDDNVGRRSPSPSVPTSGTPALPGDAPPEDPPQHSTWDRLSHRPRYEAVLATLKKEASMKLQAACTFRPQVNPRSRAIVKTATAASRISPRPWAMARNAPAATPVSGTNQSGAPMPAPASDTEDDDTQQHRTPTLDEGPSHRAFHYDPLLEDREDTGSDASNRRHQSPTVGSQLLRRRNRSMSSLHLGSFFSSKQPGTPSDVSPSSRHGSTMVLERRGSLVKSPTLTRFPSRASMGPPAATPAAVAPAPKGQDLVARGHRRESDVHTASDAPEERDHRVLSDLFIWEARRKEKLAALADKVHAERHRKASEKEAEWRAVTPMRMSPATRRIVDACSDRRINAVDHAAMVAAAKAQGIAKHRRRLAPPSAGTINNNGVRASRNSVVGSSTTPFERGVGPNGGVGSGPLNVSLDWFLEQAHADSAYARNL